MFTKEQVKLLKALILNRAAFLVKVNARPDIQEECTAILLILQNLEKPKLPEPKERARRSK